MTAPPAVAAMSTATWTPVPLVDMLTATPSWTPAVPDPALQASPPPSPTPTTVFPANPTATIVPSATLFQLSTLTMTPPPTLTPYPGEPPRLPNGCPIPAPEAGLPPRRPGDDLRGIPEHIDYFLYGGGTVPMLEAGLRGWGVLVEGVPIAAGFFDHNDQPDIAIAVQLQAGAQRQYNVWVFNCLGRVLYQAFPAMPSPDSRPTSVAFAEIDGLPPAELLYSLEVCGVAGCQTTWRVIKWVGPNPGDVVDLMRNTPPLGDNVAGVDFRDLDGDRMLELRYTERPVVAPGAPPKRDYIRTYSLRGFDYVQTRVDRSPPVYRHQQVRAADEALLAGDVDRAVQGYEAALFSTALMDWPVGDPSPGYIPVNAFARYRLMQALLLKGETEPAERVYRDLIFIYPAGVTGGNIAQYAKAFWEAYRSIPPGAENRPERMRAACFAARQSSAYPAALALAKDFGLVEVDAEMCPF
ncbi:MAG: hypothetical protein M5R40_21595 [Anaerolineae bacterium]|nr:hypothetical protein [Anaerolineae bacterium]